MGMGMIKVGPKPIVAETVLLPVWRQYGEWIFVLLCNKDTTTQTNPP